MKKKLLIIGAMASVTTAIVGSVALRKRKEKRLEQNNPFIGTWTYKNCLKHSKTITITNGLELFMNQVKLDVQIQKELTDCLVYIDQFGYEIAFEQNNGRFYFSDETEETTYELLKIHAI
ncbi:MAG: DUF4828 domain-containing protein [Enterococcus lemanii]